jgi:hypothetical protein
MTLRSTGSLLVLCVGVLWAGSLSAQDTTLVVLREDTTFVEITVNDNDTTFIHLSIEGARQSLADGVAALPCDQCGSSGYDRAFKGAIILIAGFAAWQFKKWVDKPSLADIQNINVTHEDGDTKIEIVVPPREPREHKKGGH